MTTLTIRGVEARTRKKMKELAAIENLPMGALLGKMTAHYDPSTVDTVRWLRARKSPLSEADAHRMHKAARALRKGTWARWE